ncbi:hypothetical protein [Streptosporangium sp. NPDC004631]
MRQRTAKIDKQLTTKQDETVTEATAEKQDRALAVVQRLLQERGIRSRCHHTIGLRLHANRMDGVVWPDRPALRSWLERYPPELIVTGPPSRGEATVTIGPRSGCYLVCLRDAPGPRTVGEERPEKVVELILVAGPEVTV